MTLKSKDLQGVDFGGALSSVVEHFLHTKVLSGLEDVLPRPFVESLTPRPELRPDVAPVKPPGNQRFVRIESGLYRYGPTGQIYLCWRRRGKNRWRNLRTTDKRRAMAVKGLVSYAEAQTGAHQVTVLPDHRRVEDSTTENLPASAGPPPTSPALVPPPAKPIPTLRALAAEFKAQSAHLEPSTLKTRDYLLGMLAEQLDLDQAPGALTSGQLRRVRGLLTSGRAASTVNDIFGKVLRPMLALAVEMGLIPKSPLEGIKRLRQPEPLRMEPTWEEARRIAEEVDRRVPDTGLVVRAMVYFGVGQAEIKSLRGEQVDPAQGEVHFIRRKTKKPFRVDIFPHAREFIELLHRQGRLQCGKPVFVWRNPRRALETACDRLGLPRYSPRALRRTFIVHCLELGIEPRVVAEWQGHKDATMILKVYGKHLNKDHVRRQAEKLL